MRKRLNFVLSIIPLVFFVPNASGQESTPLQAPVELKVNSMMIFPRNIKVSLDFKRETKEENDGLTEQQIADVRAKNISLVFEKFTITYDDPDVKQVWLLIVYVGEDNKILGENRRTFTKKDMFATSDSKLKRVIIFPYKVETDDEICEIPSTKLITEDIIKDVRTASKIEAECRQK